MDWRDLLFMRRERVGPVEPLAYAVRDALETGRATACRTRFSDGTRTLQTSEMMLDLSQHGSRLDAIALLAARGRVLDLGAAAGRHSLVLQGRGLDVTAVDMSSTFCELMRSRGVQQILNLPISELKAGSWDTVLLLFNGVGIAGTMAKLPAFLAHCADRLAEGGQILAECSRGIRFYRGAPISKVLDETGESHATETLVQLEYKQWIGSPFEWFWPDQASLRQCAAKAGLRCEIMATEPSGYYLARLMKQ